MALYGGLGDNGLKKTNKWGYSWIAFDWVSLKMSVAVVINCLFQFFLPNLFFRHVDDALPRQWPIVFEKLWKLSTAFTM